MEKRLRTIAIGEVLWDIVEGRHHLGGAPFNVTAHLAKMGHHAAVYSSVGKDDLGEKIIDEIAALGVDGRFVHVHPILSTSTVSVFLHEGQPDYTIHENVAWDDLHLSKEEMSALRENQWDVVIFGLLSQRNDENAEKVYAIIQACNAPHIFLDINIRKDYFTRKKLDRSIRIASIVKLNEDELGLVRDLYYPQESELRFAAEKLADKFSLDILIITLGAKGAWAYSKGKWYKAAPQPVALEDAIGAGDSFSAGFLHAYLTGHDVQQALELAVAVGAFVASRPGAIPVYDESIRKRLQLT